MEESWTKREEGSKKFIDRGRVVRTESDKLSFIRRMGQVAHPSPERRGSREYSGSMVHGRVRTSSSSDFVTDCSTENQKLRFFSGEPSVVYGRFV